MENTVINQGRIRNQYIDALKGIAIIAVLLYHCELLNQGYLGVDVFFVVNGFFLMKGYLRKREDSFKRFLSNQLISRIIRLWPLIIIMSVIVMAVGFFVMLPDDYENLSESVIASNSFLNNVLCAITSKDYWNISNNYKPLMHLWYVGVLLQSQLFLAVFFRCAGKKSKKQLWVGVIVLTAISFALYLTPVFSSSAKFYFFPFRLFEILAGSIIALILNDRTQKNTNKKWMTAVAIGSLILVILLCTVNIAVSDEIYLIGIVVATSTLLFSIVLLDIRTAKWLVPLSVIGMCSYSIYIVHQPVIAFTRYLFTSDIKGTVFVAVVGIIAILSVLAYRIERISIVIAKDKKAIKHFILCASAAVLICGLSGIVYLKAGVVRDVPELNLYKETAYKDMHAEYVTVPYSWDRDFSDDKKIHILVIGDSMARDWCNILNESEYSDSFEISYTPELTEGNRERLEKSDFAFYATLDDATEIDSDILKEYVSQNRIWIVGVKNFGENNGQVYRKRHSQDYFSSSITLGRTRNSKSEHAKYRTFTEQNEAQKKKYGSRYINMISAVQNDDGTIPVFTDTNKFISSDTIHLTKAGAEYYSRILDLSWIHK